MSAPTLPMPITAEDLAEVCDLARLAAGEHQVHNAQLCRAGAMLSMNDAVTAQVCDALTAAGYTVTRPTRNLVHVSGAVDRVAVLDAEIARLTELRGILAAG